VIRIVRPDDRQGRWIAARTTAVAYGLSWHGGVAGFLGAVAGVCAATIGDDSPGVVVTVVTAALTGLFVWLMVSVGMGVVMWRVPGRSDQTLWLNDAGGARACVMVALVRGSRDDVRASTLGAWPRGRGRARELGEHVLEHHRVRGERMLAFAVTPGLVAKYGEQGLLPIVPGRLSWARLADTRVLDEPQQGDDVTRGRLRG
jgi:hypothetical protein